MTSISVEQSIDQFRDRFVRITEEVARRIVGHEEVVNLTVTSLLAGGHVLLEGIPGVGKTSLVHTLADVLHLKFSRIQFTPDLMPADIVGRHRQEHPWRPLFVFQPGPIFAKSAGRRKTGRRRRPNRPARSGRTSACRSADTYHPNSRLCAGDTEPAEMKGLSVLRRSIASSSN
jgi:hypothetical protein